MSISHHDKVDNPIEIPNLVKKIASDLFLVYLFRFGLPNPLRIVPTRMPPRPKYRLGHFSSPSATDNDNLLSLSVVVKIIAGLTGNYQQPEVHHYQGQKAKPVVDLFLLAPVCRCSIHFVDHYTGRNRLYQHRHSIGVFCES